MSSSDVGATSGRVVVRSWSGTATTSGAQKYRQYFSDILLPKMRKLAGFSAAYLLSRDVADGADGAKIIELTTHTFWESLEAIHTFAGTNISTAVVSPEAQAYLLDFERVAVHRNLLVDCRLDFLSGMMAND